MTLERKPFSAIALLKKEAADNTGDEKGKKTEVEELEDEVRELTEEIAQLNDKIAKAKKKKEDGEDNDDEMKSLIGLMETKSAKYVEVAGKHAAEITKKFVEARSQMDKANDRIKHLEDLYAKSGGTTTGKSGIDSDGVKNFFVALKKDGQITGAASYGEVKALNTLQGVDGGYLCPPEFAQEILKKVTEISQLRGVARVRTINAKELKIPKRNKLLRAYWTKELAQMARDQSEYGQLTLTPHKLTAVSSASREALADSSFDLASEILADIAEAFAYTEGKSFVNGLGDAEEQPYGFLQDTQVPVYVAATSPALTAQDITNTQVGSFGWKDLVWLTGQLKNEYARNAMFAINRTTLATIMMMTDNYGRPIWQSGLAAGRPDTIAGHPYIILPDMPQIGVNTTPVVFADFQRFYAITDREGVEIVIDPLTRADFGEVRYIATKRVGGSVTMSEAGILLKTKSA
jgi:HK97 family phage major capsid protein